MPLSDHTGKNSFNINNRTYNKRTADGYAVFDLTSGGARPNWSTGWVNSDGTTNVADGAKLTFNHNLGTADITAQVYVCDNPAGTGEVTQLGEVILENTVGNFATHGAQIQDITSQQLTVSLSYYGYAHWTDGGTAGTVDPVSTRGFGSSNGPDNVQKYIKVVATAGAGGSTGAGVDSTRYTVNEYPASTRAGGLTSDDASSNSWGSAWAGLKLVDFKDGLSDARTVVSLYTGYGTNGPVLSKGFEDLVSYVRINNVDWVVAGSYWIRPDVNLGNAEIDSRTNLHWHNKVLSLWVNFNSLGVTSRGAHVLVDVL